MLHPKKQSMMQTTAMMPEKMSESTNARRRGFSQLDSEHNPANDSTDPAAKEADRHRKAAVR